MNDAGRFTDQVCQMLLVVEACRRAHACARCAGLPALTLAWVRSIWGSRPASTRSLDDGHQASHVIHLPLQGVFPLLILEQVRIGKGDIFGDCLANIVKRAASGVIAQARGVDVRKLGEVVDEAEEPVTLNRVGGLEL